MRVAWVVAVNDLEFLISAKYYPLYPEGSL